MGASCDRALDAILATLKAIVDDIVDDIVTRGMACTLDVCCWRSLDVSSIDIYIYK